MNVTLFISKSSFPIIISFDFFVAKKVEYVKALEIALSSTNLPEVCIETDYNPTNPYSKQLKTIRRSYLNFQYTKNELVK